MFGFALIALPSFAYEDLTGRSCVLGESEPIGCICQTEQVPETRRVATGSETAERVFFCEFDGFDDQGLIYNWHSECCFSFDRCIHEFRDCSLARNSQSDADGICPTRITYQFVTSTRSEDLFTCNDPNFGLELDCSFCELASMFLEAINNLNLTLENRLNLLINAIDRVSVALAGWLDGFNPIASSNNGYFQVSTQILVCPSSFYNTDRNFVFHLIKVFENKFPFDFLGDFPEVGSQILEIELAFGVTIPAELVLGQISVLKLPVLVAFLVYAIVKL